MRRKGTAFTPARSMAMATATAVTTAAAMVVVVSMLSVVVVSGGCNSVGESRASGEASASSGEVGLPASSGLPAGVATPDPYPRSLDGDWVIAVDLDPRDFQLDGACVTISRGMLTAWYGGCGSYNSMLTPAPVHYDEFGPWFEFHLIGVGDLTVYLEGVTVDLYAVEFDTPYGDWFGYMERI